MVQQNQHRNLICFMLFAPLQIKHFNYVADGCRRPRQLAWFIKIILLNQIAMHMQFHLNISRRKAERVYYAFSVRIKIIRHVESWLLIICQYQSACSTPDLVSDRESDFGWVLYEHYWEFPTRKKIIPMLTCLNVAQF